MSEDNDTALTKRLDKALERIAQLESILERQAASLPGAIEEISVHDRQRTELEKSRNTYRKLFNYANDAMFVISLDEDSPDFGYFSDVNNVACKQLGFSREEILRRTPFDISDPNDFFHNKKMLRVLNQQGSATFETTYLKKNGTPLPVEINALRLTIDGRDLYMAIARDITERKQAEADLRERERLYRLLADNVHDIIWTTDCGLSANFVSPSFSRQTGLPQKDAEAIISRHVIATSPFWKNREHLADLSKIHPLHWESVIDTADKSKIWVESIISPLPQPENRFSGIIGVTRDITARKNIVWQMENAREEAFAASQAKSNFLANMSHEVRTPMNGVLGMLQLLKLTSPSPEQMDYIETAMISGKSLLTIINDILDYSKIEAGKLQLTPEDFKIRETVETLITSFSTSIDPLKVEIRASVQPEVPEWLVADPVRIRQVLFNLVGNAVKFTESGTIQITINHVASENTGDPITLHCTIRDTGIGIPSGVGDRIFDPFTQLDTRRQPRHKGTGLGLSIVRQLVQQMGGTIQIRPNRAKGTTVEFTLQVHQTDSTPLDKTGILSTPILTSPHRRLRTLLVEDEQINQQILQAILTKIGHSSIIAADGEAALDLLTRHTFDIILMDVQMPGMDGLEATRRIRTEEKFSHLRNIPIIALTAYAMAGDKEKCLQAGMDSYLAKPVDVKHLNKLLQELTRPANSRVSG